MRFIILSRKHIVGIVSAMMVLILTAAFSISVLAAETRKLPIYNVESQEKKIAISFDAAWGNDDTGTLIEILAKYNVKATFFVVGSWVDKYPESVKQLFDAGHRIENHSNSHPYMTKIDTAKKVAELEACNQKIAAVTGVTPTLFRCPYGDYNNAVVETVESLGMYTIQWDVDSRDWQETASVQSIVTNVVNNVAPGSIVLFHNDAEFTPEALPTILEKLLAEGYEFVFIEDLIMKENYEIDHKGMQIAKTKSDAQ